MSPSESRAHRRIGVCLAAALFAWLPSALAQTYDVKINPTLNGLDVGIEPVATDGMLIVNLTNRTQQKVRCNLRYDPSPQPLHRATEYLDPGETVSSTLRAKRKWFSVAVDVTCETVAK